MYAVRKVSKAAEAYTPAGVAHGLSDFADGMRELAAAVREGMAEREGELRLALGIDTETAPTAGEPARLDPATCPGPARRPHRPALRPSSLGARGVLAAAPAYAHCLPAAPRRHG